MYHEFQNITNATILQVPYAEALLYLKNMELDTIGELFLKTDAIGIIIPL